MKTSLFILLNFTFVFFCFSQTETQQDTLLPVAVVTDQNPVIPEKEHAFKVFTICNDHWSLQQDVYNAIQASVPNVSIKSSNTSGVPNIRMRGDNVTIVFIDGVRYDASILNALNPADIEHIKISNSIAALNYLRSQ